jgi:quinol monooxygenase YgiN
MVGNIFLDKEDASKIVRTVSKKEGFHFYKGLNSAELEVATSLEGFATKLRTVDLDSVDFHFQRGDFQKWIDEIVGDGQLSLMISKIDSKIHGKDLRSRILKTVNDRVALARMIVGNPTENN